jgi:SPP1 gp7 family putative phage head morphogenesis protein
LETDEFAAKYGKNYFYNDATPPLVIEAPGATQETADRFKESWMQKVGGLLNARKPAIIPWKDSKITKLADSVREMDFVESRRFLRDICNQHFSLPPELMGILENSNRSTIDSAYYLWTKNVITKKLQRMESTLNRQFVSMFDKSLVLCFDNIVPQDEAYKLNVVTTGLSAGAVTINEWRTANGLPPDEKGGDTYLRPFSVVTVPVEEKGIEEEGTAIAEPTNIQQTALNGAQISSLLSLATSVVDGTLSREAARAIAAAAFPTLGDAELNAIFNSLVEGVKPQEPKEMEPVEEPQKNFKRIKGADRRAAIWKSFDQKAVKGEKPFINGVKKISAEQQEQIKKLYKKFVADGETIEDAVNKTLSAAFGEAANAMVKDNLAPAWLISMKNGFDQAKEVMGGGGISFDIVNPLFRKWIDTNGLLRAEGINDTTEEKLRTSIAKSLAEGIEAGEGKGKLSNRILDATDGVYEDMDRNRANLIARTETASTVNYGQFETYKEDGVTHKEWLSTQDDRTREDHIDADGDVVPIDEEFTVGGDKMLAPGLGNDAGQNCNCRCTILPVIEE